MSECVSSRVLCSCLCFVTQLLIAHLPILFLSLVLLCSLLCCSNEVGFKIDSEQVGINWKFTWGSLAVALSWNFVS